MAGLLCYPSHSDDVDSESVCAQILFQMQVVNRKMSITFAPLHRLPYVAEMLAPLMASLA